MKQSSIVPYFAEYGFDEGSHEFIKESWVMLWNENLNCTTWKLMAFQLELENIESTTSSRGTEPTLFFWIRSDTANVSSIDFNSNFSASMIGKA